MGTMHRTHLYWHTQTYHTIHSLTTILYIHVHKNGKRRKQYKTEFKKARFREVQQQFKTKKQTQWKQKSEEEERKKQMMDEYTYHDEYIKDNISIIIINIYHDYN